MTSLIVNLNELFHISQPGNPTTGYQWFIDLSSGLRLINEDYLIKNNLPGSPDTYIWTIQAIDEGSQYIRLLNRRSWEAISDREPIKNYTINVI